MRDDFLPTPGQIAAGCLEVSAIWSDTEAEQRRRGLEWVLSELRTERWEPPVVEDPQFRDSQAEH